MAPSECFFVSPVDLAFLRGSGRPLSADIKASATARAFKIVLNKVVQQARLLELAALPHLNAVRRHGHRLVGLCVFQPLPQVAPQRRRHRHLDRLAGQLDPYRRGRDQRHIRLVDRHIPLLARAPLSWLRSKLQSSKVMSRALFWFFSRPPECLGISWTDNVERNDSLDLGDPLGPPAHALDAHRDPGPDRRHGVYHDDRLDPEARQHAPGRRVCRLLHCVYPAGHGAAHLCLVGGYVSPPPRFLFVLC